MSRTSVAALSVLAAVLVVVAIGVSNRQQLVAGTESSGEEPAKPAPRAPGQPAAPGPIHQQMARRAGEYVIAKKIMVPGQTSLATGHATLTSVLGGRFLREENDGTLFGQPVASSMITGYNDETEKFESVWGWTGSNRLFLATGTSADAGKTVRYTSSYDNGKGKTERIELEFSVIDDDHFVVKFVEKLPDGRTGVVMESTYTRKK